MLATRYPVQKVNFRTLLDIRERNKMLLIVGLFNYAVFYNQLSKFIKNPNGRQRIENKNTHKTPNI